MTFTRSRSWVSKSSLLTALLAANVVAGTVATRQPTALTSQQPTRFWEVQAVDTMKYSRDLARTKLKDPAFDVVIERQVAAIAASGATHVAIGTPYDEEFVPMLKRWVEAARRHKLSVWFRGNWSGWEKWFGYKRIGRAAHLRQTDEFIRTHVELFADGDIFTACPECENGGPGDPRRTGDAKGFRRFLIDEYAVTKRAFSDIGKDVRSNFISMNGDVARLVMDRETTAALDGNVTIDHYVATPQQLRGDVKALIERSGGRVVLGELGVPIPDIHGNLTAEQQAQWLEAALRELSRMREVIGVNYWLAVGGSTQLWSEDGKARPAAAVLAGYFKPRLLGGMVRDEVGRPISGVQISDSVRSTVSDLQGHWQLPRVAGATTLTASAQGYTEHVLAVYEPDEEVSVTLVKLDRNVVYDLLAFLVRSLCATCR